MRFSAFQTATRRLAALLLGPVARATDLAEDRCSAAILSDLRWTVLGPAAPGISPALGSAPMPCTASACIDC